MRRDVLALPVLATWGLIDGIARLAVRMCSVPELTARDERTPVLVRPAGGAADVVQLPTARVHRSGPVPTPSGAKLQSVS